MEKADWTPALALPPRADSSHRLDATANLDVAFWSFILLHCRPIGNMRKTIDFIGDLKSNGHFLSGTLRPIAFKDVKRPLFSVVFMRFLWDDCDFA